MDNSKKRLIAFAMAAAILSICSVLYVHESYGVVCPILGMDESVSDIYIDGSDFTPIFQAGASITESILCFFVFLVYGVLILVTNAVTFFIMWLVSVRKSQYIPDNEVKHSLLALLISFAVSLVVSVIVTDISYLGYSMILLWQAPLCGGLIYILPLFVRGRKLKREAEIQST